ncbi:MAG TPA: PaaI family thioesterase [Rhizomicrobium sp.]|jgi:uncharacterized protein (TIGR00369 family)|nr:PaaI family thioesterase [Rhizomicrobium sp.]
MSDAPNDFFESIRERMSQTAYFAGIGAELVHVEAGKAQVRLPYGPHLVGDPDTGVVHGGVITGLLDQTCGMAVGSALREHRSYATLDLRIDYMKAAKPHQDILVEAETVKVAHEIVFTRGIAYQESRDVPIAMATGTFMMTSTPTTAGG